uniref:Interleukin-18-like n=1 Tax=Paramormyrops kingsleyae TaxID=1676925 RepID=A0A3B3Q920_9TELE|nr:interleukin-18-like isoform X2 [Paramormyrops kingsleyae]
MTNSCVDSDCVDFATIIKNEIFFEIKDPAYEEDAFAGSNKLLTSRIQNKNEQFLVLGIDGGERLLEFRPLTVEELKSASCRFLIRPFRNTNPSSEFPITLQILSEGKTWTLWCLDEGGSKVVYPNLQDPPDKIESTKHEALFFLMKIKGHRDWYRVASSMWPSFFLSFECKPQKLVKLVLKEKKNDDESLNLKVRDIQRCSQ